MHIQVLKPGSIMITSYSSSSLADSYRIVNCRLDFLLSKQTDFEVGAANYDSIISIYVNLVFWKILIYKVIFK
jgi:hypothetical protein